METSQTFESTIAEDEKEELRMPTPPVDWALNDLLIKIADELTTDDFEKAKAMFKGRMPLSDNLICFYFYHENNTLAIKAAMFAVTLLLDYLLNKKYL